MVNQLNQVVNEIIIHINFRNVLMVGFEKKIVYSLTKKAKIKERKLIK